MIELKIGDLYTSDMHLADKTTDHMLPPGKIMLFLGYCHGSDGEWVRVLVDEELHDVWPFKYLKCVEGI